MTQTTTAQPLTIPATGLVHTAGDVTIRAYYVNAAGYKVEARRDGQLIASQLHTFETDALQAVAALIAEHTPAAAEPTTVKLAPVAKGTATKVSDPQHTALGAGAYGVWRLTDQDHDDLPLLIVGDYLTAEQALLDTTVWADEVLTPEQLAAELA
jgi:hypothetical protein